MFKGNIKNVGAATAGYMTDNTKNWWPGAAV
jgi:hypothetical protein